MSRYEEPALFPPASGAMENAQIFLKSCLRYWRLTAHTIRQRCPTLWSVTDPKEPISDSLSDVCSPMCVWIICGWLGKPLQFLQIVQQGSAWEQSLHLLHFLQHCAQTFFARFFSKLAITFSPSRSMSPPLILAGTVSNLYLIQYLHCWWWRNTSVWQ